MTQHNKSGADKCACGHVNAVHSMTIGKCTLCSCARFRNDAPTPVADAGAKRPEEIVEWTPYISVNLLAMMRPCIGGGWMEKFTHQKIVDSLELQLTQTQGKNVELAERVDGARLLVQECQLQLEYLEGKGFGTATSNQLHAKLEEFLRVTLLSSAASGVEK